MPEASASAEKLPPIKRHAQRVVFMIGYQPQRQCHGGRLMLSDENIKTFAKPS